VKYGRKKEREGEEFMPLRFFRDKKKRRKRLALFSCRDGMGTNDFKREKRV